MSVESEPYYWIVCDCCGAKCDMGDYSAMSDESEARTAADMREEDLKARLNGDTAFTVNDLVRVGGFLRLSPARFMEGLHAC